MSDDDKLRSALIEVMEDLANVSGHLSDDRKAEAQYLLIVLKLKLRNALLEHDGYEVSWESTYKDGVQTTQEVITPKAGP